MDDSDFTALSARLRYRIDSAFDKAAGSTSKSSHRPRKKRRLHSAQSSTLAVGEDISPGGFLIGEDAGGFILDEHKDRSPSPKSISILLSRIPTALELLGLPAEDEEVLSVFQNAASGWGADSGISSEVSRKDWRAVCAALLEAEDDGESDDDEPSSLTSQDDDDGSGLDSDEYHMSGDGDVSEPEAQDDDKSASRKPRNSSKLVLDARLLNAGQLNGKQKAACREDFARFFPDVPDTELEHQKIMIKDVTSVTNLLKEKIKVEEVRRRSCRSCHLYASLVQGSLQIIEMLEAFSTSADKSMNLHDFERMMIATKLIR